MIGQRVRIPHGPTGLVPRHDLTGVVIARCECDDWLVRLDQPVLCECDGQMVDELCEAADNMVVETGEAD